MIVFSVVAVTWLVFLRTFTTAHDQFLDKAWRDWKSSHAKVYHEKGEEALRRSIWEENLQMIQRHNLEASQGQHTYWLGMNHFGDLMTEEFNQKMNGFRPELATERGTKFQESVSLEIPKHVDWSTKGFVTSVKDQSLYCGSCWAFSATGALEALHFKKTGKLVSLSEQNLIDCSWKQGNNGCCGGHKNSAFKYVMDNGINSEHTYPYEAKHGPCRFKSSDRAATCTSFEWIEKNNESALAQAVATVGPVSVAVDASHFQFYKSGIFFHKGCSAKTNHAMLAVGYGTSTDGKIKNYWILKNSYGKKWGENGYMKLAKDMDSHCGVASNASYPTL